MVVEIIYSDANVEVKVRSGIPTDFYLFLPESCPGFVNPVPVWYGEKVPFLVELFGLGCNGGSIAMKL